MVAGTDEQVEARKPGRPRDARADEAIIDATLQLLGQGGIAGVSIDAAVGDVRATWPTTSPCLPCTDRRCAAWTRGRQR